MQCHVHASGRQREELQYQQEWLRRLQRNGLQPSSYADGVLQRYGVD
jgi:hypothetical protein